MLQMVNSGVGVAHGTFGELLQGALPGTDNHFLITLPIKSYSTAVFTPLDPQELVVDPPHKLKSLALIKKILKHFKLKVGGRLTIISDLPEGKGMASSSADMVATARSLASALHLSIPPKLLMSMLRTIEPTDGVMFPDYVSFFHRRVELCNRCGFPSAMKILYLDEGGQIDTVEYNRRSHCFTAAEYTEYKTLLSRAEAAIGSNDLHLLGEITTRSALLHQKRNPKRYLQRLLTIREQTGALGIVVTHSGPCIGLLFAKAQEKALLQAKVLLEGLEGSVHLVTTIDACPAHESPVRK